MAEKVDYITGKYVVEKVDCIAESTWRRRFLEIIVNDNVCNACEKFV